MRTWTIGHRTLRSWHMACGSLAAFAAGTWFAACAAAAGGAAPAAAGDRPLAAHVIWSGGGRLYLASEDSLDLPSGSRLTLMRRHQPVASAVLERVVDGHLLTARLLNAESRALRKPGELEVRIAGPSWTPRARLRIGIPGRGRPNPFARCASDSLSPPGSGGWRADRVEATSERLVRAAGAAPGAEPRWPDTLEVRRFEESTDEEIALERGELDVAVFWAGELSAAARQRPDRLEILLGARAHEALAAEYDGADSSAGGPSATERSAGALDRLNRERYRGDLEAAPATKPDAASRAAPAAPTRFRVDTAIAGHAEIERALNSGASTGAAAGAPPGAAAHAVLIRLVDTSTTAATVAMRARCAVVCEPGLGDYVRALGADAFAELPGCGRVAAP